MCGWTMTFNGTIVYLGFAEKQPKDGPKPGDIVYNERSNEKCILLPDGTLKPIGVFCINHCIGDMSVKFKGRLIRTVDW